MTSPISEVVKEIDNVKTECLALLSDLRAFHPLPTGSLNYPSTFKLLVVPLLYAAWQRCFTLCNAIAWKRLRDETTDASALTENQRAVWLIQTGFYQSFTDKLLHSATIGSSSDKPKRFHQPALAAFLKQLEEWEAAKLDLGVDIEKLVMTFSNVNADVVNHNAQALGIDSFPAFEALKLGRLHSLVGFRNDIGHGGTIQPPPDEEFAATWSFTEKLIADYSEMFKAWVVTRFPPPPPPPTFSERLATRFMRIYRALGGSTTS
jgi:hypothetical protein